MVAVYAFPEAHWRHLRTTNAAELLAGVYADAVFTDGSFVTEEGRREVA
jgi:transposase-like protein